MKLLQLNIEGDAHIESVRQFIAAENPDIACIQEVMQTDLGVVCQLPFVVFMPMIKQDRRTGAPDQRGVALYSREPFYNHDIHYYHKVSDQIQYEDKASQETKYATIWYGVITAEVAPGLTIATVHHTWVQDGDKPSKEQVHDTDALLAYMKTQPEHIIVGDFNIPRGYNKCYETLTSFYEDCVPQEYASSMHIPLHKVRHKPMLAAEVSRYMVDYIFRTKHGPQVTNVVMKCGMSDHCALTADIRLP